MAPKPPPEPPGPAVAGVNGAAAAAAGAAAANAAAAGRVGGLSAWWLALTTQHLPAAQKSMSTMAKQAQVELRKQKLAMPVDVKVDFLRPTVEALQESVTVVWSQLPPPVQQAAPYVGVGLGTGLLVFAVQQRRLNKQRQRGQQLEEQVAILQREKTELVKRINSLKLTARSPRTEVEARMAAAVAEATNAAAAAADAAARAATACILRPQLRDTSVPQPPAGPPPQLPPPLET